jgi:cardiolipin synthase
MPRNALPLRDGHQASLLEGAREYFPALLAALGLARNEVLLETYILDFTGSTLQVVEALILAARRGVRVQILVDGVGTGHIAPDWSARLLAAGVDLRVYAPLGTLGLLIPSRWRRLHRKLVVVDGVLAFCGGINLLDDHHDPNHGALDSPRLDYAVRIAGPLVTDVHDAMTQLWRRVEAVQRLRERHLAGALETFRAWRALPAAEPGRALIHHARALLLRDNLRHRLVIEQAYRRAIGMARREEVIIANAYFLPGRKLRKALVTAAQRGRARAVAAAGPLRVLHAVLRQPSGLWRSFCRRGGDP